MTRRDPNLTEKNAALVLAWLEARGEPVPHEHQKLMTAAQICSLVTYDHYPIRFVDGGTTHPSNLSPKLIQPHRKKTAEIDVPQVRKADRIRRADDAAVNRLLAKDRGEPKPRSAWPQGRKIQSRGFQGRRS